MFVRHFPQTQSSCQMERWNLNLDSLLDINHALLISIFCAKLVHIHFSTWRHHFGCQHTKASRLQQSFFCMLATENFTFHYKVEHLASTWLWTSSSLPYSTRTPLQLIFFSCVVKSRYCDCIPFQLSLNHLIPINLITAGRDGKWESGRVAEGRAWPKVTLQRAGMQI